MSGSISGYQYISDDGGTYKILMDDTNATAVANVGATTEPALPKFMYPRHIYVENASRRRKLVVGDPANALWVGGDDSVNIKWNEGDLVNVDAAVRGRIGERRFGRG